MIRHAKKVRRVLLIEMAGNIFVAGLKLVYGLMTGTLSMVADGVHSLTDMASNIIGLISLHIGSRPSDQDHHYGHHKYETIAALAVGAMIGLTGWEVLKNAISRLATPREPEFHYAGIGIMVFTMMVNITISTWELRKAKEYDSALLKADSFHTASDVWVSLSVLVSLLAIRFRFFWADPVISIGIALYLGWVAYRLVRENVLVLTDAAYIDPDIIKNVVLGVNGVISCHHIRTRGKPGYAFVDLHIQVDSGTDTGTSHRIVHEIEGRIKERIDGIKDVLIHTEPWPDFD